MEGGSEGGREEQHWEIWTIFPGRFESSDTGAMEQDSGCAKEEDGMAGIKHLPHKQHWANPAAGNSQNSRLGRCSSQPQHEASFREIWLFRYPITHDFKMLWPNVVSAAGMPRSCCYKSSFMHKPVSGKKLSRTVLFQISLPPHKTNSIRKPAHCSVWERQPQRKEDQAIRKQGKEGCCEEGCTSVLLPKEEIPSGAWGHHGVIEGHKESHTTPLCYFFHAFLTTSFTEVNKTHHLPPLLLK